MAVETKLLCHAPWSMSSTSDHTAAAPPRLLWEEEEDLPWTARPQMHHRSCCRMSAPEELGSLPSRPRVPGTLSGTWQASKKILLEFLGSALGDSVQSALTFVVLSSQHNKPHRASAPETDLPGSFRCPRLCCFMFDSSFDKYEIRCYKKHAGLAGRCLRSGLTTQHVALGELLCPEDERVKLDRSKGPCSRTR
ncbi:uncharacterized protein RBU33_010656 [Hipposideros larvatus]